MATMINFKFWLKNDELKKIGMKDIIYMFLRTNAKVAMLVDLSGTNNCSSYLPLSLQLNRISVPFQFNSLLHEFCFPSIFEKYPKAGSHRLPTYRRGAHAKFLHYPFLF